MFSPYQSGVRGDQIRRELADCGRVLRPHGLAVTEPSDIAIRPCLIFHTVCCELVVDLVGCLVCERERRYSLLVYGALRTPADLLSRGTLVRTKARENSLDRH